MADMPEAAILMTSSPRSAWEQQTSRQRNDAVVRPAVRRRCSCGCQSTPSPTGNSLSSVGKPEVEINRSRDGVTSQYRRVSKSGRVKPAIEMTPYQVLQVYVLNDRQTGSDVSSHVTRAPVNRRAASAAPSEFSRRGFSNFPAKSHHQTMTTNLSKPDVSRFQRNIPGTDPVFYRQTYQRGTANNSEAQNRSFGELRPPSLTARCLSFDDKSSTRLSSSNEPSLYEYNTYQPAVGTASLDRRTVASSSSNNVRKSFKSSVSKKPVIYSSSDRNSRLRRAVGISSLERVGTASLDRQQFEGVRLHVCRGSGADEDRWLTGRNDRVTFNVRDSRRTPAVGVGTTSSAVRGRAPRRQDDDEMTAGFLAAVDRRRTSTTGTGRALVDSSYQQRQSTSLERDEDMMRYRSRGLSRNDGDWTRSRWITRPVKDVPADEIDQINCRWIKRQIHLPVSRQRRILSSAEVSEMQRQSPRDGKQHVVHCDRNLVSSRSDPDNVCFRQAPNSAPWRPTELVHRTRTRADPSVRVEFTRDNNGNLLKVIDDTYSTCFLRFNLDDAAIL